MKSLTLTGDVVQDKYAEMYNLAELPCITFTKTKDAIDSAKDDEIMIQLSSDGGDLQEAMEIYDYIKNSDKQIGVHYHGIVASAATVIGAACSPIVTDKDVQLLYHSPWVDGVRGNSDELRMVADMLDQYTNAILDVYEEQTNHDRNQLNELLKRNELISADEALSYGLIDATL
jgi:ATP-dependent protease ClpP protease subunit